MEIVRVTKDNSKEVSRIYAEGWKIGYKGIIDQDYLDSIPMDRWANKLDNSKFQGYVLVENHEYIAASTVAPARDGEMEGWGEIISMYVLPKYFRKGYGSVMFRFSVEKLKEMGFKKIYLWVLDNNERAKAFYSNNGFIPTEKTKAIKLGDKSYNEKMYILKEE